MFLYMTVHLLCMRTHDALACTYICSPFISTAHLQVMGQKEKLVRLLDSLRIKHHEKRQHCHFIETINHDLD